MSIQDSKQYCALEFDGLTYDGPFNGELQWLAIEGQALLAIERQGFWKDTSN